MGLSDDIDNWRKNAVQVVQDSALDVEFTAKNKFAPIGATQALLTGIRADRPRIVGDSVECFIFSAAYSGGFDYAEHQHNTELAHVATQPINGQSFVDYGETGSAIRRYRQGYRRATKTPKYATQFLDLAIKDVEPRHDQRMAAI